MPGGAVLLCDLHRSTGTEMPPPATGDRVLDLLVEVAECCRAAALLPPRSPTRSWSGGHDIPRTLTAGCPWLGPLSSALAADPVLGAHGASGLPDRVRTPSSLVLSLVTYALVDATLTPGADHPDLTPHVCRALDLARALTRGETTTGLALIGMSGVLPPPTARIPVAGGTLLAADAVRWLLPGLDTRVDSIVALDHTLSPAHGRRTGQDRVGCAPAALDDAQLRARLAVALAGDPPVFFSPGLQTVTVLHPFGSDPWPGPARPPDLIGPTGTPSAVPAPRRPDLAPLDSPVRPGGPIRPAAAGTSPAPLDGEHARRVTAWSVLLVDLPDRLTVAARHVLAALGERADARDGLVDAVSCWESLFGTDPGAGAEASFQVCAALALLLEPDPCRRPALLADLQRLHRIRTRVRHTDHEPAVTSLDADRDRTVAVALRALGAVLLRPDLLSAGTSAERAARVVLGLSADSLVHEARSRAVVAQHRPAAQP